MLARRDSRRFAVVALMLLVAGCTDPTSAPSEAAGAPFAGKAPPASTPTVTATLPSEATRDTTLDVQITGSGFDSGSRASFERDGVVDPRVRVNSTRFVKSTSIVANVTIAADAVLDLYNVAVVTGGGKKGMGTELFAVTLGPNALVGGTHVNGVNVSGDAVGRGPGAALCSSESLPFLWRQDGSRVSLPLGTYCAGVAWAINESGVILGWLFGGAATQSGLWIPSGTGYTLQVLPPAPDGYQPATQGGLNDAGEVIGWAQGIARLYWWSAATGWLPMQVPAGATTCQVHAAINNLGAIAGRCSIAGKASDGYYWQDHNATPVLLPRPSGTGDVYVWDMNDAGVVVGYMYGSPTRAVKWTPTGSGYTVSFLPDLGVKSAAYSIAQDGTVSGSVNRTTNNPRPALWLPAGGLTLLGLLNNGNSGEAMDVAATSTGLVAGGTSNQTAVRWKVDP